MHLFKNTENRGCSKISKVIIRLMVSKAFIGLGIAIWIAIGLGISSGVMISAHIQPGKKDR